MAAIYVEHTKPIWARQKPFVTMEQEFIGANGRPYIATVGRFQPSLYQLLMKI